MNTNGWSQFSPITHIKAATIPQRPPAPVLYSSTADSITLSLFETQIDGGEIITEYELFVNQGTTSTDFTKVTTYDGFAASHTVTVADDALVAGTIYKFKYRATNEYGASEWSEELDAGVSSLPAKATAVRRILSESTETQLTLEWDTVADTELPVIGYTLRINDGVGGSVYTDIFTTKNPNIRKYIVGNLTTGLTYGFTIEAINFNSNGEASDPALFIVCTAPRGLDPAEMIDVTSTTMTLEWKAPNHTGGCPVQSYYIFKSEDNVIFTEVDAASVNNLPALRKYTLTFDGADTGKLFTF
jgi:hypothetical protein